MSNLTSYLNACKYSDLSKNTPVINLQTLEYFTYVNIQPDICNHHTLFQIQYLGDTVEDIIFSGLVERENCWLKIISDILKKTIGQHIYKLSFVNKCNNDVISLYFSYIIQDDNPNKPYTYMN